ncbi:MAG TPA: hypothetical protein VN442_23100 [Bryobacteraceae bacterium]|nr:hypothetical protein [Bryobacteraceae bacterium]
MVDQVDEYLQQAVRHGHVDGLDDAAMGLFLFAAAIVSLLDCGPVLVMTILPPLCLLVYFSARYARQRVIWPRAATPYMPHHPWQHRSCIVVVGAAAVASGTAVVLSSNRMSPVLWMGYVMALSYCLGAWRWRLRRYLLFGALSIVLGTLLHFRTLEMKMGMRSYFALMGTAMLAGGIATLVAYLRRTARPAPDAE